MITIYQNKTIDQYKSMVLFLIGEKKCKLDLHEIY